jgi:hypothetical protein
LLGLHKIVAATNVLRLPVGSWTREVKGLLSAHQHAHHLPRGTAVDDAGAIEAGHTGDLRQGAGGRAGGPTCPTVGHTSQQVDAGVASTTVLAAHPVLASLTCRDESGTATSNRCLVKSMVLPLLLSTTTTTLISMKICPQEMLSDQEPHIQQLGYM